MRKQYTAEQRAKLIAEVRAGETVRVVVVDTGPPDGGQRGDGVRRALAEAGRRPQDVSLIVATHAT